MTSTGTCFKALLVLLAMFTLRASAGRQPWATLGQTPSSQPALVQAPAPPAAAAMAMRQGSRGKVVPGSVSEAAAHNAQFQHHRLDSKPRKQGKKTGESIYGHRLLVGSSAPTCQGKCGPCNPCNPIHMAIGSPRGALTLQEYYPEVWRCKCGGTYFMP